MPTIRIPNNWKPRPYQREAWDYLEQGGKHLELIAHRRWGKDDIALHRAAVAMFERPATYWHMLPQANQVRKAIWDAVNPHTGIRRVDEAFPKELFTKRESDMMIKCVNGATWQALGSDNFQSFIGSPPAGIVYSEWALANPSVRGYLRPILAENGGWQVYITTPRGRNHAYKTFKSALNTPGSKGILQTVEDTGALTPEQLKIELQEYIDTYGIDMGTALYQQEWFCSFDAAILGAIFGAEVAKVEADGRITSVPHQPGFPVYTAWDIGRTDATAIWFYQVIGGEIHVIDFLCDNLKDPDHFCSQMIGQKVDINIIYDEIRVEYGEDIEGAEHRKEYEYSTLWLPHDARAKTFAAKGKSLQELLAAVFGWKRIGIVPGLSRQDGIQAARKTLPRCYFDVKCDYGIEALKAYRYEWNDERKVFSDNPLHDWASNPADAFRYLAIVWEESRPAPKDQPVKYPIDRTIIELIESQKRRRIASEYD